MNLLYTERKARYSTKSKRVPIFVPNSKPFCDSVRNFSSSVKFHEILEDFVKSKEGLVRLHVAAKVPSDIAKWFRIRYKNCNPFRFCRVPVFFSVRDRIL